jgi:isoleucyl-tRNA synthetase
VLHTEIDDDLRAEGFVRELTNKVQAVRKELNLGYTERVALRFQADGAAADAIGRFGSTLADETLCTDLAVVATSPGEGWDERAWDDVDGHAVRGWLRRLG